MTKKRVSDTKQGEWRMYHDIWNNRARGWEDKGEIKK